MLDTAQIPLLRADDAGGNRRLQSERRPDRYGPIAHLHGVRVTDLGGNQRLVSLDLDHGEVRIGVGADQLGVIFGSRARQTHLNTISLLDHVIVRQDIAIRIDNDAGTEGLAAAACLAVRRSATEWTAEKFLEKLLHGVVACAALLAILIRGRYRPAALGARMRS